MTALFDLADLVTCINAAISAAVDKAIDTKLAPINEAIDHTARGLQAFGQSVSDIKTRINNNEALRLELYRQVQDISSSTNTRANNLNADISKLERHITHIGENIAATVNRINTLDQRIEARFMEVERKLAVLENHDPATSNDVLEFNAELATLRLEVAGIRSGYSINTERIDKLEHEVECHGTDGRQERARITRLEEDFAKFHANSAAGVSETFMHEAEQRLAQLESTLDGAQNRIDGLRANMHDLFANNTADTHKRIDALRNQVNCMDTDLTELKEQISVASSVYATERRVDDLEAALRKEISDAFTPNERLNEELIREWATEEANEVIDAHRAEDSHMSEDDIDDKITDAVNNLDSDMIRDAVRNMDFEIRIR